MPRKKTARTAEQLNQVDATIDHQALEEAGSALSLRAQQITEVEQQFGIDMPYDLQLYIARIRQHASESALRLVEIGRMFIVIRERESRDVFRSALETSGISVRFAQRCMQTAVKLQDRPMLQQLGVSKALELLGEDDDTLDALEEGGTLAGRTLDELDTMTVRELKETLRTERQERSEEKEADEEIIRAKDERINKLTRDKRKRAAESDVRAKAEDLLRDADEAAVEATSQIAKLSSLFGDVTQLYADAGMQVDGDIAERLDANARWAADQLRDLADLLGE